MWCAVGYCPIEPTTQGLCRKHYARKLRNGSVYLKTTSEKFWDNVKKDGECLVWTKPLLNSGYGHFRMHYKWVSCHRYAYTLAHGEIPDNLVIDHLCHNKACVRVEHLRLATTKENADNRKGLNINNSSGYRGVFLDKGKWRFALKHYGKVHYLNGFANPQEASNAGEALRKRLER